MLHSVKTYAWITGTHLKAKHGYLLLLLEGWVVRHRRIIGSDWLARNLTKITVISTYRERPYLR